MFPTILILSLLSLPAVIASSSCINPYTLTPHQPFHSQINDNYCDCLDGSDEPLTDACSGIYYWAGSTSASNSNTPSSSLTVKCPLQNIFLPVSRLNDGICDCCDGSDEEMQMQNQMGFKCIHDCAKVLQEDRIRLQTIQENYDIGSKKRLENVDEFHSVVQQTFDTLDSLQGQIYPLERMISEHDLQIDQEKTIVLSRHLEAVQTLMQEVRSASGSAALEEVLGMDHMLQMEFISAACQLHGEMNWFVARSGICDPLRLAGLDAQLVWDIGDGAGSGGLIVGDVEELANAFLEHAGLEIGEKVEEEWVDPEDAIIDGHYYNDDGDDDDIDDLLEEDDDDYDGGGGYDDAKDKKRKASNHNAEAKKKNLGKAKSQGDVDIHEFRSKFGKLMRADFHQHAEKITSRIDAVLSNDDNEEEEDFMDDDESEDDESNVIVQKEELDLSGIDPMAVQMVRNTLSGRIAQIEYGNELVQSAQSMLTKLKDSVTEDELSTYLDLLVVGVINRANLSEADVLEVIAVLHADVDVDADIDTCILPYALVCRDPYMRGPLLQRCQDRQGGATCGGSDDAVGIPLSVPDGYYSYYVPKPRGENDAFTKTFHGYENNIFQNSDVARLDREVQDAKKEVDKLKDDVKKLKNEIGMNDKTAQKFGVNGELYSIRDECFEITAGKYTYETCMFGRSYQRDGSGKKTGTDLGKWEGASIDEKTGTRIWKWTGGQKCWNGPKRSATVLVTCGAETKIISADEPNICEYEFKMESYIGCDDSYRTAHEIQ